MTNVILDRSAAQEVPTAIDNKQIWYCLLHKAKCILDTQGYEYDVDLLEHFARVLVTAYGTAHGKSNLILWRLNLLSVPQLTELAGMSPVNAETTISPDKRDKMN